jgi:hypothetical protein
MNLRDDDLVIPAAIATDRTLSPAAKLVYGRLLFLARDGGLVFIARFRLARLVGLFEEATQSALAALERRGYVVLAVHEGGRNRPRGYRVWGATPRPVDVSPVPAEPEPQRDPARVQQLMLFDTLGAMREEPSPARTSLQSDRSP